MKMPYMWECEAEAQPSLRDWNHLCLHPALKRRAILDCPSGTNANHDRHVQRLRPKVLDARFSMSLVTSRAMKSPGAGAVKAKTARSDSMGKQIPSGKAGHRRKRVLRSRRETAARSVDSQHESSVIEPRNETYCGSLCCEVHRGETEAPPRQGAKSCRGPRVEQTCTGVVREHGKSETSLSGHEVEWATSLTKPNSAGAKILCPRRSQEQTESGKV